MATLAISAGIASAYNVVQPALPYDYDALEPAISKETMTLHHDKHHAAYTKNFKDAVEAAQAKGADFITDVSLFSHSQNTCI